MKRTKPATGHIYHVFNRGVEKRNVFINDYDRMRFIYSMLVFNNKNAVTNANYFFDPKSIEVGLRYKDRLVKILAFVLMPNHYHLMLEQIAEDGITEFMRKLGTGYTNYFNIKYKRVGPLFQGKYKAVLLQDHRHLLYLPYYIHLNPLDLIAPEWREQKIKNIKQADNFLKSYRWSSHLNYAGQATFTNLIDQDFLKEIFTNQAHYKKDILDWLKEGDLDDVSDVILE
ncbi:MAG: Transposase [Candidatus Giovannonibacteria bacterium GW2011_GWA1_43_15]|uniref:Transposase n=2 Tax=Candidatus Giovannoniibacteriota TaxID=1752738 RepID=A0A0G1IVE5_9BACT|nr:MAG: Transposase [Candidatus Giovannonibacteria bacterium GW2011_GWB1_43_13]KKS99406.1 MAG: Transposase [Candidatus Giovannonibacteria bacterium GW2011_GWA1_43_15]KKT62943.1 MAG: Transposase [Candidatus Giovannonibacteria bacterium GW2011_GWA2_44_26]